ncbi:MAG: PKD domain-containing protein [Bacteroidota bacterium]
MQNRFSALLFLCLLVTCSSQNLLAQRAECGTKMPANYKSSRTLNPHAYERHLQQFRAGLLTRSSGGSCINSYPIKAHIVRETDGTGGLTETQLNDAIDIVNGFYVNSCMEFYLCGGVNYIDNSDYYDFNDSDEAAMTGTYNVNNLINIYFCNSVGNGTSFYCGYAYFPGGPDVILMDNSCTLNGSTLSHEIGHFFSLPHTHSGGDELVNGSNCTTAGDEFCDTEADPQLGSSTVNSSCIYTGTAVDANGDPYAPNPRNVMSYSRKACRDFFSVEQYAAMAYSALYVRNYWDCVDFKVDFTVDNDNSCSTPFTANFTEEAEGETTYEWDFENDGVVDATGANPSHIYATAGSFDVCLTVSDGTTSIRKVKTTYIVVGAKAYPYFNDLETFSPATNATGFQDNWTTSPSGTTGSYRWNVDRGGTPSNDTGPDIDHTTGTGAGIYIHTEASFANQGDIAELISPCLDVPAAEGSIDPSVCFWYHMYGSNMGTLHIDLHDGTNWINDITPAISGQQHTSSTAPYSERIFSVSAYKGQAIQIRFRSERGSGFRGDMAIDEFRLFENGSLPVELTTFQGSIDERGQHLLTWQTASEENSGYFQVEHAVDGINFIALTKVDAQGQSVVSHDYWHTHPRPAKGVNYYRLKMVDLDESFEYLAVISLEHQVIGEALYIYPNPGQGQYYLEMPSQETTLTFEVHNAIGQSIRSGQWTPSDGPLQLNLTGLSNGIYTVQLRTNQRVIALEKLVKY